MHDSEPIDDGLSLLRCLNKHLGAVRATDIPNGEALISSLGVLANRTDLIRTDFDLLQLLDEVHRLVENDPGLRASLLEPEVNVVAQQLLRTEMLLLVGHLEDDSAVFSRSLISDEDDRVAGRADTHPQRYAPVLRNLLEEASKKIADVMRRQDAGPQRQGQ